MYLHLIQIAYFSFHVPENHKSNFCANIIWHKKNLALDFCWWIRTASNELRSYKRSLFQYRQYACTNGTRSCLYYCSYSSSDCKKPICCNLFFTTLYGKETCFNKGPFKNDVTMKMLKFRPPSPYVTVSHFFHYIPPFSPCQQENSDKLFSWSKTLKIILHILYNCYVTGTNSIDQLMNQHV